MANPEKPELGLLEEDDEFEEFPAEGTWFIPILQTHMFYFTK
jgi:hypothetical protein